MNICPCRHGSEYKNVINPQKSMSPCEKKNAFSNWAVRYTKRKYVN